MTDSSSKQGRTLSDIANELRFAAEDMRINNLSAEEMEKRYSHMIKFLDYLDETEPGFKEKCEMKAHELAKQRFFKNRGIQ